MDKIEFTKKYPPLSKSHFNVKKFKKSLKKKFNHAVIMCRLKITGKDKDFNALSDSILDLLNTIFSNNKTFYTGNIYFILTIMSNHIDYLHQSSPKMHNVAMSKETLENLQQEVIDQHEGIKEALFENLSKPVNFDSLPDALGLSIEEKPEKVTSGE